jgi:hypothetical protein
MPAKVRLTPLPSQVEHERARELVVAPRLDEACTHWVLEHVENDPLDLLVRAEEVVVEPDLPGPAA